MAIEKLKPFINGKFTESAGTKYMDIFDPPVLTGCQRVL